METKAGGNLTPNTFDVAINPFVSSIEVVFTVRDILAHDEDLIVFLAYAPKTSASPQLSTPRSVNELKLDLSALEILAMYHIPAQGMLKQQSTRFGAANPAPGSALSFRVNLNTSTLPKFLQDQEKAYIQAASIPKADFEAGRFDTMILSELDTVGFVDQCPENETLMAMDNRGTLTSTSLDGSTTKTVESGDGSGGDGIK
jgi:hypothetical protein